MSEYASTEQILSELAGEAQVATAGSGEATPSSPAPSAAP